MSERITKKVREEAAILASIGACDEHRSRALDDARQGIDPAVDDLYWEAWGQARQNLPDEPIASGVLDAEAEALLRTGWSPSDGAP